MADTPDDGATRSPLDVLIPGLGEPEARFPLYDVHPRAVQTALPGEGHALLLCSWRCPESAADLHGALRPLIEAALLAELSRPVQEQRDDPRDVRMLQLMAFAPFAFDAGPALRPFGLAERPQRDAAYHSAAALLRAEAQRVDGETPEDPVALYAADLHRSTDARLLRAEAKLMTEAPGDPWGAQPGVLARAMADALSAEGIGGIEPSHAGILALEKLLVPDATGVIRWQSPLAFQALCDLLAVAAHGWGMEVQWGVCEPDEETRLAPPPLIRAQRGSTSGHVPLGEHVLRWCIMPRQPGEDIPSLADWARHEFAG